MTKNEVTCPPHQITSKEVFYNWSKLTMIPFPKPVEAPIKHIASPSFNKSVIYELGGGGGSWEGYLQHLNTPALVHMSQEVTETSLGA